MLIGLHDGFGGCTQWLTDSLWLTVSVTLLRWKEMRWPLSIKPRPPTSPWGFAAAHKMNLKADICSSHRVNDAGYVCWAGCELRPHENSPPGSSHIKIIQTAAVWSHCHKSQPDSLLCGQSSHLGWWAATGKGNIVLWYLKTNKQSELEGGEVCVLPEDTSLPRQL